MLRDNAEEWHVVFMGRAPLWAPPPLARNLESAIPDDVKRDRGQETTEMLIATFVFLLGCWLLRTRTS